VDVDTPLDLAKKVIQIFVDVCLADGDWVSKINKWAWGVAVMPLY
jgi:hypothetical protein